MYRTIVLLLIVLVSFIGCQNNTLPFSQFENATTPLVLGKGTLSLDSVQWNNVYVAKTKELYFTKMGKSASIIHKMDYKDDGFKNLEKIAFPDESPHSDIYVTNDGDTMLFSSLMQEHVNDTISDWNIWKSVRKNGKWQTPIPFFNQNLEGNQFYPWLTRSGNIYFAITPHGSGNSDLYVSEYKNGAYGTPKALPAHINSKSIEGDAYVAPDETYIIFAGFERGQNLGKSDLFVSFNENGNWTTPVWLGEEINSVGYDGSPFVTEDGNYLIFTSSRGSTDENTFFNHYIVKFNPEIYRAKSKTLANYLAQIGNTPSQLDLGNISTTGIEYGGSLSLKTEEIVFTRASDDFSSRSMMLSEFKDGQFSTPQEMKIGEIIYKGASDVQFSNDGAYLYFKMRGHILNDSLRKDGNIWRSKRNGDSWEKAELLPETINSKIEEYYPIPTNSGNLYFSRELPDTSYDIYVSRLVNGEYQKAERLPDYINTKLLESDAYVSPDESYMIFVRMNAEGDLGVSDLYISFNEGGSWSHPINMRSINSKGVDGSPFVTSDGKHLIFTSTRDSENPENFDGHLDIYAVKFNKENWR
ncbi:MULTISPECIES: TolB family protein [Flavobacteriaceae]|uniref:TolB family protein n=1 Tax=Flavobacteriaceae TaxID=49546 RepID=UPI001490DB0D|nr:MULTISPECIES: PD40 domain-containing protein [Allomuricauda]MDC6364872.1 PD40 domain-containing protein [Muricauda sp. AC10]